MLVGAWLRDPSARDGTCWTPSTQVGRYRPEQSVMNAPLHHAGVTSPDSDSITLVELIADFSLLLHIKSIFNVPGTRWNKMSARGLPHSPWVLFIPGGATWRMSLAYFVRCRDILWNSTFNPLCQAIYLFSAKCICDYFSVCWGF